MIKCHLIEQREREREREKEINKADRATLEPEYPGSPYQ